MAYTFAPVDLHGRVPSKSFRQLLIALGARLERYTDKHARGAEVARLQSKDDAELARMGLSREGIFAHVFQDRFVF